MDNTETETILTNEAEKIMSRRSDLGGRVCFALSCLASSGPKSFSMWVYPRFFIFVPPFRHMPYCT